EKGASASHHSHHSRRAGTATPYLSRVMRTERAGGAPNSKAQTAKEHEETEGKAPKAEVEIAKKSKAPVPKNGGLSGYRSWSVPVAAFLKVASRSLEFWKHAGTVHWEISLAAGRIAGWVASPGDVAVRVICTGSG